jgi:hypothetical protein
VSKAKGKGSGPAKVTAKAVTSADQPDWLKDTSEKRVDELGASFRDNLRQIAEALAREAQSEVIVVKHVDEAHTALAKLGLSRRRWYERSEGFAGVGGALIGLAFATPDVCSVFLNDGTAKNAINVVAVLTFAIVGTALFLYGWLVSRFPRAQVEKAALQPIAARLGSKGDFWLRLVSMLVLCILYFAIGLFIGRGRLGIERLSPRVEQQQEMSPQAKEFLSPPPQ